MLKDTRIKHRTYYLFKDMINTENFDSNLLKLGLLKKLYKNIDIYYIGQITINKIDDYKNIYSVNRLYLIINEVDRHIEEKMGINIQFVILQIKTEKYQKNIRKVSEKYAEFGMWLKIKLRQ